MTRAKETVVMTIENMWDWMELFDNGDEDEIELELDAENLDVFFPIGTPTSMRTILLGRSRWRTSKRLKPSTSLSQTMCRK